MKERKLIFKAEGANRGLVHVYLCDNGKTRYYEVKRDRKLISGASRYWTLSMAMQAAVEICERDIIKAGEGTLL